MKIQKLISGRFLIAEGGWGGYRIFFPKKISREVGDGGPFIRDLRVDKKVGNTNIYGSLFIYLNVNFILLLMDIKSLITVNVFMT